MNEQNEQVEVKFEGCDTMPQSSVYRDGYLTDTTLVIDTRYSCYWVEQCDCSGAVPAPEWNGEIRRLYFPHRPQQAACEAWAVSDEVQALIAAIVNEDEDSEDNPYADLEACMRSLPESETTLWSVEDWLEPIVQDLTQKVAQATDAEIEALAAVIESEATAENVVISGDVVEYLLSLRDEDAEDGDDDDEDEDEDED